MKKADADKFKDHFCPTQIQQSLYIPCGDYSALQHTAFYKKEKLIKCEGTTTTKPITTEGTTTTKPITADIKNYQAPTDGTTTTKPITTASESLPYMEKGSDIGVLGPNGSQYKGKFYLDSNKTEIRLKSQSERNETRISVKKLHQIRSTDFKDERVFSIIYGDELKRLYVNASTSNEASIWVAGLTFCMLTGKENKEGTTITKPISTASDYLRYMQQGSDLVELGPDGNRYKLNLYLDSNMSGIRSRPLSKKNETRILLKDVQKVRTGKITKQLRKYAAYFPDECVFSVMYGGDHYHLDVIASTSDEAFNWVTGLSYCMLNEKENKKISATWNEECRDKRAAVLIILEFIYLLFICVYIVYNRHRFNHLKKFFYWLYTLCKSCKCPNSKESIPLIDKLEASDCLHYMQQGSVLFEIRPNVGQNKGKLYLDSDRSEIRWKPLSEKHKTRILVEDVCQVSPGKNAEHAADFQEDCAFSIIYGSELNRLNVIASASNVAAFWVKGLTYCMLNEYEGNTTEEKNVINVRFINVKVFKTVLISSELCWDILSLLYISATVFNNVYCCITNTNLIKQTMDKIETATYVFVIGSVIIKLFTVFRKHFMHLKKFFYWLSTLCKSCKCPNSKENAASSQEQGIALIDKQEEGTTTTKPITAASDCLRYMQQGSDLVEIRPDGNRYKGKFYLDSNMSGIQWKSLSERNETGISVKDLHQVRRGKNTEHLLNHAAYFPDERVFSIIYGGKRMDVMAPTSDEAYIWVRGLTCCLPIKKDSKDIHFERSVCASRGHFFDVSIQTPCPLPKSKTVNSGNVLNCSFTSSSSTFSDHYRDVAIQFSFEAASEEPSDNSFNTSSLVHYIEYI